MINVAVIINNKDEKFNYNNTYKNTFKIQCLS